jgi:hypothetical protein
MRREIRSRFVLLGLSLLLGVCTSWGVARIQARLAPSGGGAVVSSAFGLWREMPTPSKLEWFRWGSWAWEQRGSTGDFGVVVRRVPRWPGSERLPELRTPFWSDASEFDARTLPDQSGWAACYEAGFGWPVVCLVSEDYEEIPIAESEPQKSASVFVVHGARWRRTPAASAIGFELLTSLDDLRGRGAGTDCSVSCRR